MGTESYENDTDSRRLPVLTAALLAGGMVIFISKDIFSVPVEKVFVAVGTAVFFAGLVVSFIGTMWSIWTLTSPVLRRTRGVTTPVITILIAAFAWSGAWLTLYKFKKSNDVRVETNANASTNASSSGTNGIAL